MAFFQEAGTARFPFSWNGKYGFKRSDTPTVTKSMRIAIDDLRLDALYVVYPGAHRFELAAGIEAVPLWSVLTPQ